MLSPQCPPYHFKIVNPSSTRNLQFLFDCLLRLACMKGIVPWLVPATCPLKTLHEGTGQRDLTCQWKAHIKHFEEHVAGTCPINLNQFAFLELVPGTKFWSPWLVFVAKLASSTFWWGFLFILFVVQFSAWVIRNYWHKLKRSKTFFIIQEKSILQLTFNPWLALTSFQTTYPWALCIKCFDSFSRH